MPRAEPEQLTLFELGPSMSKIREASAALKRRTRASATHTAYESDWRAFAAWCASAGRVALPATGETLALYVTARLQAGKVSLCFRQFSPNHFVGWVSIGSLLMQLRFLRYSEGLTSLGNLSVHFLHWSVAGFKFLQQLRALQFERQQTRPKL